MAIVIKNKNDVVADTPAPMVTNALSLLPTELAEQVKALDATVVQVFTEAPDLTPELIELVADKMPESLLDGVISALEEYMAKNVPANPQPVPAAEVVAQSQAKPDDRKARRDALKAQIAANAGQGAVASPQNEKPVTPTSMPVAPAQPVVKPAEQPVNFSAFDTLFPVGQQVTVINRGNGKFELHIGKVAPAAAVAKEESAKPTKAEKKPKAASIQPYLVTDEYNAFVKDMQDNYPDLGSRQALAESLGLKPGTDWAVVTKDNSPMPPAIQNMFMTDAIRKAKGIEQYVEGARTKEERKAILDGTAPWPATAKPRK